jgi:hypothetical protein
VVVGVLLRQESGKLEDRVEVVQMVKVVLQQVEQEIVQQQVQVKVIQEVLVK